MTVHKRPNMPARVRKNPFEGCLHLLDGSMPAVDPGGYVLADGLV